MAAQAEDRRWIAEAIVEFLRSPAYTHPLMVFIDEKCMVFTPEDENKLEYTAIHAEFQVCCSALAQLQAQVLHT